MMLELCDGQLKLYSSVTETAVDWLWYPYIPFGKITIIQGDPGEGKTTLGLQLASACSNGHGFPGMVCVEVRCSDSSGQQLISVKIC